MTTYDGEEILSRLRHPASMTKGIGNVRLELEYGDKAWNPASTKKMLRGPCVVTYVSYPDGGVEAVVRDV